MKTKLYMIQILVFSVAIFSFTSCDFKPLEGNKVITKKEFQIKDFNKIEVGGYYNIILSQGDSPKLVVETDENLMEYIDVKVSSSKLKIKNKRSIIGSNGITIYLTFNKLEQIIATGFVSLSSADKLNFDKLKMDISGKSEIGMNINCVELKSKFYGNSIITLTGTALNSEVSASGNTSLSASEMLFDNLKLDVSGNALAKVNVISNFDVSIKGNAQVEYQGTPEMKQEISGSGAIIKKYY